MSPGFAAVTQSTNGGGRKGQAREIRRHAAASGEPRCNDHFADAIPAFPFTLRLIRPGAPVSDCVTLRLASLHEGRAKEKLYIA